MLACTRFRDSALAAPSRHLRIAFEMITRFVFRVGLANNLGPLYGATRIDVEAPVDGLARGCDCASCCDGFACCFCCGNNFACCCNGFARCCCGFVATPLVGLLVVELGAVVLGLGLGGIGLGGLDLMVPDPLVVAVVGVGLGAGIGASAGVVGVVDLVVSFGIPANDSRGGAGKTVGDETAIFCGSNKESESSIGEYYFNVVFSLS